MLYLLIHGEASNVRHLPEMICFLFFCASSALTLEPTEVHAEEVAARASVGDGGGAGGGGASADEMAGNFRYELKPADASTMPYPADDFVETIITPVYLFLEVRAAGTADGA